MNVLFERTRRPRLSRRSHFFQTTSPINICSPRRLRRQVAAAAPGSDLRHRLSLRYQLRHTADWRAMLPRDMNSDHTTIDWPLFLISHLYDLTHTLQGLWRTTNEPLTKGPRHRLPHVPRASVHSHRQCASKSPPPPPESRPWCASC